MEKHIQKNSVQLFGTKMRKGEIEIKTIVFIILLVIVFLALLMFPIKSIFSEILSNQNCKNSVKAATIGNVQGMDIIKEINCPTQDITLKGNEEELKRKIIEEMWTCWDNFGRGEYELFSASTEKFCVVCSNLEFDRTVKEKEIEIKDFSDYIKSKGVLQGGTLIEKMLDLQHEELRYDPNNELEIDYTINTQKDYAVVFTYAKEDFWSKGKKAVVWGTAAGTVTGIVLIATGVGSPAGIAVLAATAGVAGGVGGALHSTPEAEPGQEKGDSALWRPGIVLIENDKLPELECTHLPIKQGNE